MAYTRGLVAGFEINSIDDLIHFANAFGALRLREACINFKDLWNKKHADDLWIKEVAAMQSCLPPAILFSETSGIVLANDTISHDQDTGELETSNSAKKEDVNLASTDAKPPHAANVHMPMPWPYNVPPPYMYNLQQISPYQGYPMTNMQHVPPHLLRNMQWSSDMGMNQKPSETRKKKSANKKGHEEYEEEKTESSDSDSGSESNSDEQQEKNHAVKRKKNRRKSSGTVVIRNINYITPKRRNGNEGEGSDESSLEDDDTVSEEAIKQKVGAALESLQKVHKVEKHANGKKASSRRSLTRPSDSTDHDLSEISGNASEEGNKNDNWNAFQSLLKIDEDIGEKERVHPIDVHNEHFMVQNSIEEMPYSSSSPHMEFKEAPKNPKVPSDSFIVNNRNGGSEGGFKLDEYVDSRGSVTKMKDSTGEDILLSNRLKQTGNELGDPLSTFAADSSLVTKIKAGDDCFIVDNLDKNRSPVPTFDGDCILSSVNDSSHAEKRSQENFIDDSFMIQGQLVDNNPSDSQWRTDIVAEDLVSANFQEADTAASKQKPEEPSDLYVVLQRDSGLDSVETSRTMDYEIDFSFTETCRRPSIDANKDVPLTPENDKTKTKVSGTKSLEKDKSNSKGMRGSAVKSRPEITPRNKRTPLTSRPIVQKSKREQEDEIRKRMEELALERQRRIAERTALSLSGLAKAAPRKDQGEGKAARVKTQSINRTSSTKVRGT
ncbi:hypothetical protein PIB30_002796 [Stylosanthes scabra]|uniref:COP1-interacting protein 7 n=1 Tax=Stylosanthes scabra TaxID=79078 RepID=A0ABU6S3T2_9FABA|nr:hypothetical protein [Stylosanthes scabra]